MTYNYKIVLNCFRKLMKIDDKKRPGKAQTREY
jgi:hypothetical protein